MKSRKKAREVPVWKRRTTNGMSWSEAALVGDAKSFDGKPFPPAPIMARLQPMLDELEKAEAKTRKRAGGKR